jgi:hypothetical protein
MASRRASLLAGVCHTVLRNEALSLWQQCAVFVAVPAVIPHSTSVTQGLAVVREAQVGRDKPGARMDRSAARGGDGDVRARVQWLRKRHVSQRLSRFEMLAK